MEGCWGAAQWWLCTATQGEAPLPNPPTCLCHYILCSKTEQDGVTTNDAEPPLPIIQSGNLILLFSSQARYDSSCPLPACAYSWGKECCPWGSILRISPWLVFTLPSLWPEQQSWIRKCLRKGQWGLHNSSPSSAMFCSCSSMTYVVLLHTQYTVSSHFLTSSEK